MTLICPEPLFIDSADKLEVASKQWQQSSILAVDTEFMRTNTFYPYLGLIQLSDGKQCWLVDPLADIDLGAVKEILVNPNVIKVFHACSEDLDVLTLAFEVQPTPLIDTQVAAAIAGIGFGMGYNKLLNQVLDTNLDKHETRSDWLQRPLSAQQLYYAAEDVYYLFHLYPLIDAQLKKLGRQAWLEEDMETILNNAAQPSIPAQYYLRIKSAWRLSRAKLGLLQQLCTWRENEAMLRNKPRGHIIKDDQLLNIAQQNPATKEALTKAGGLHPGVMRRYGDKLLELISLSSTAPEEQLPPAIEPPLDRGLNPLLKQIKAKVNDIAEHNQLPKEILAAKRDIDLLVRHGLNDSVRLSEKYSKGWRGRLVLDSILDITHQYADLQVKA